MQLNLIKRGDGALVPSLALDHELMAKIGTGEIVRAEIKKPRNIHFHRKFFALLHTVLENQETYHSIDELLIVVKVLTGYYDAFTDKGGEVFRIPRSISFAKMDEYTFSEFYQRALEVIVTDIIPGMDPEDLEDAVEEALGFA